MVMVTPSIPSHVVMNFRLVLLHLPLGTVLNWDDKVTAPCEGSPCLAWRALEILVIFITAFNWEGTCPVKVKQSLTWDV